MSNCRSTASKRSEGLRTGTSRNGQNACGDATGNNNNNNCRKNQNPLTRLRVERPRCKIRGAGFARRGKPSSSHATRGIPDQCAEASIGTPNTISVLIAAAQGGSASETLLQQSANPQGKPPQGAADDVDEDDVSRSRSERPGFAPQPPVQQPQPFIPRDAAVSAARSSSSTTVRSINRSNSPRAANQGGHNAQPDVNGLPAFITGGGSRNLTSTRMATKATAE